MVGYKTLFLLRVVRTGISVSNLVYILEDNINHVEYCNHFTSIDGNGCITIGTIIRFLKPKPYKNIMPDGNPSLESRFPVSVMSVSIHVFEMVQFRI